MTISVHETETVIRALVKAKQCLDKITDGQFDWVIGDIDEQLDIALRQFGTPEDINEIVKD